MDRPLQRKRKSLGKRVPWTEAELNALRWPKFARKHYAAMPELRGRSQYSIYERRRKMRSEGELE